MAYGTSWNPLHWLSKAMHYATHAYYGIVSVRLPYNQLTMLNFGGNEDVTQYLASVRACLQSNKEKKVVLFGSGRGAATILVSLLHLTQTERARIALAILESPFATVQSLYDETTLGSLSMRLLQKLTRYEADQRSPLNAVRDPHFPLQIPLAFVSSESDRAVPDRHTRLLLAELRARHHPELAHLSLFLSGHSTMALAEEESGRYLAFVGELYNKYCL
jgi:alpha-beta hydrolase superfamily lysophospholipase